jgi:integrase
MAHVEDQWYRPNPDGTRRKTARHGTGRRWRVRYLDPDGREHGKSFDRRVDADRFKTQVEADVLRGTYLDPDAGKVTLRRYAEGWAKGWHADSARGEKLRGHLANHIIPGLGGHTLAQLAARPSIIQQWLNGLPLAEGAANQVFITLSAVLSAAADDGLIGRNPCKAGSLRPPRQPRRKVVPWTSAEVKAIRAALPERYRATADCAAGLGLRQGEILALGPDETDFLRRVVHVRRQVKRVNGRLWFAPPKGLRERDVPLAPQVALALSASIAAFPPVAVTLPWNQPGSKRHGQDVTAVLMFTTRDGKVVNPSSFNSVAWRNARRTTGIAHDDSGDGIHALRHYYASVLLAGGVDVRALAEYLGHHDPAITLRIYAHLMPGAETRALRAIEEALEAAGEATDVQDHGTETARGEGNGL